MNSFLEDIFKVLRQGDSELIRLYECYVGKMGVKIFC